MQGKVRFIDHQWKILNINSYLHLTQTSAQPSLFSNLLTVRAKWDLATETQHRCLKMQQEESCSSLLSEWGRKSGGCACSDIHVKPFGTSRIPGHSAEINGCYSEVSTSCCQSKKCKLWYLGAEHLGMLEKELHLKCWGNFSCCRVWQGLCLMCFLPLCSSY